MKTGIFYNFEQLCKSTLSSLASIDGLKIDFWRVDYRPERKFAYELKEQFGRKQDDRWFCRERVAMDQVKFPGYISDKLVPDHIQIITNYGQLYVDFDHAKDTRNPVYSWLGNDSNDAGLNRSKIISNVERDLCFVSERKFTD